MYLLMVAKSNVFLATSRYCFWDFLMFTFYFITICSPLFSLPILERFYFLFFPKSMMICHKFSAGITDEWVTAIFEALRLQCTTGRFIIHKWTKHDQPTKITPSLSKEPRTIFELKHDRPHSQGQCLRLSNNKKTVNKYHGRVSWPNHSWTHTPISSQLHNANGLNLYSHTENFFSHTDHSKRFALQAYSLICIHIYTLIHWQLGARCKRKLESKQQPFDCKMRPLQ